MTEIKIRYTEPGMQESSQKLDRLIQSLSNSDEMLQQDLSNLKTQRYFLPVFMMVQFFWEATSSVRA